ncbi:hypothetical protein Tco_1085891, partial [Tanacetum coccineum]
ISNIKQFWATAKVKTIDGETHIHAFVDGQKILITEASVREILHLTDAEGIESLPNSTIFENLALMGVLVQRLLGEGSAIPADTHHTPTLLPSTSQPAKTYTRRFTKKDTQLPQASAGMDADEATNKEWEGSLVRAATTVSSLAAAQDNVKDQSNDIMVDSELLKPSVVACELRFPMICTHGREGQNESIVSGGQNCMYIRALVDDCGNYFEVKLGNEFVVETNWEMCVAIDVLKLVVIDENVAGVLKEAKGLKKNVGNITIARPEVSTTVPKVSAADVTTTTKYWKRERVLNEEPPVKRMSRASQLKHDAEVAEALAAKIAEENKIEELDSRSSKKQKVDEQTEQTQEQTEQLQESNAKETANLQQLVEITSDSDEEFIIRVGGQSQRFVTFLQMLQEIFDREDLETLWALVKDKYGDSGPENILDRVLWGDLKVMFGTYHEYRVLILCCLTFLPPLPARPPVPPPHDSVASRPALQVIILGGMIYTRENMDNV